MFKVNNKDTRTTPMASLVSLLLLWTYFTPCSSVSVFVVNFEQVNAGWVRELIRLNCEFLSEFRSQSLNLFFPRIFKMFLDLTYFHTTKKGLGKRYYFFGALATTLVISLQTHHVYSTLKQRGIGCFHVISTWNACGVFVGITVGLRHWYPILMHW